MKLTLVFIMIVLIAACHSPKANTKLASILTMPSFSMLSISDHAQIKSADIPAGQFTLFVYFDPGCEHCQYETAVLARHSAELKGSRVYLITENDSDAEIRSFDSVFHLEATPNISVLKDDQFSFFNCFRPSTLPFMAVYDRNRKLRRIYEGETDISSIVYSLN